METSSQPIVQHPTFSAHQLRPSFPVIGSSVRDSQPVSQAQNTGMLRQSMPLKLNPHPEKHHNRQINYTAAGATFPGQENFKKKTNQDQFLIHKMTIRGVECGLFCIFDGHGPNGHKVSGFLQRRLPGRLIRAIPDHLTRSRNDCHQIVEGHRAALR